MRTQIASDLHLEFLARTLPSEPTISPAPGADLLLLAGDISVGSHAVQLFRDWPVPVIYVVGNHEAYRHCWSDVLKQCELMAQGTSVRFLERGIIDFGEVRVLGCTLWTDYCLYTKQRQHEAMEYASQRLNDHRLIRNADASPFSPADALREHERAKAWLTYELSRPYRGRTVVMTHHGPHRNSVHPRYEDNLLNAAFVSDLTNLMSEVDLWVHGHVHDSFDCAFH